MGGHIGGLSNHCAIRPQAPMLIILRMAFYDLTVAQAAWTVADVARFTAQKGTWVKGAAFYSNTVLGAGPGPDSQTTYNICTGYKDVSISFSAGAGSGGQAMALVTWDAATASGYAAVRNEVGTVDVVRWDAGADSRIATISTDAWLNDADTLKMERIGSTINIYQNDVLQGTIDDATYTFGAVGMATSLAANIRFYSCVIVDRPTPT